MPSGWGENNPAMKLLQDDIAIVGMGCLFAGACDLQTFWENIISGKSGIGDHPDPQAKFVLDPGSDDFERVYSTRGGFLGDQASFDPLRHGVMPNSVEGADPDHFLALRVAEEALADASLDTTPFASERTEVIIGHGTYVNPGIVNWIQHGVVLDQTIDLIRQLYPEMSEDEERELKSRLRASLPPITAQVVPALVPNIIAGRIANRFNLMGRNYVVDAACASSLIAVENASQDLLLGHCDLAIVGGVQGCVPVADLMLFARIGALSRHPELRPFDRDADGTMLGEGVGMVVLKRKKDAERQGDRIYALIKGIGVSSDGRGAGLLAPRVEGQTLALSRAYKQTGISPDTVGLIEAHGTGIPLGDQTEVISLTKVFGFRQGKWPRCALGSVKSMVGHCVPAAGIAGLIKATLALYHKVLPPTLNCDTPHAALELESTPFYIISDTRPWVHGRSASPRRAGVSAMGFGGINTHCILEEHSGP